MKVLLIWDSPDGSVLYLLPSDQAKNNPWLKELCGYFANSSFSDNRKDSLLDKVFDLLAPYGCLGIDGLVQEEGDWVRFEVSSDEYLSIDGPLMVVHCGWC